MERAMSTVRSLLKTMHQEEVFTIDPESTVLEALGKMREKKIGSLIVAFAGQPAGIFTERDNAWKVELEGRTAKSTLVKEVMTPRAQLVTTSPGATLDECMAQMVEHHVRHMPVMENETMIAILSIMDVMTGLVRYYEFLTQEMRSFISQPG
jgi:CBS domain-containing protein